MTATRVVGLDLSLRSSGVAAGPGQVTTIRPGNVTGMDRLHRIRDRALDHCRDASLVVIEGYSYGSKHRAHQMGELGGIVRYTLWTNRIPYIDLAPGTLKKLATGKGNSNKYGVMSAAMRRLGYAGTDDNEADALWLRQAGLHLLGLPCAVTLPKTHTAALIGIDLPPEVMAA